MSTRGGTILAKALSTFGVSWIFSLPGHQILSVYDACIDEGIELISTRHEASAVYMAEATSFATRDVGVALLAGGPELTNALTGIARAHFASTPLLVISGTNTPATRPPGIGRTGPAARSARPTATTSGTLKSGGSSTGRSSG